MDFDDISDSSPEHLAIGGALTALSFTPLAPVTAPLAAVYGAYKIVRFVGRVLDDGSSGD